MATTALIAGRPLLISYDPQATPTGGCAAANCRYVQFANIKEADRALGPGSVTHDIPIDESDAPPRGGRHQHELGPRHVVMGTRPSVRWADVLAKSTLSPMSIGPVLPMNARAHRNDAGAHCGAPGR